jgi:hypothetical protein
MLVVVVVVVTAVQVQVVVVPVRQCTYAVDHEGAHGSTAGADGSVQRGQLAHSVTRTIR